MKKTLTVNLGELELSWKELNETVNHIASR